MGLSKEVGGALVASSRGHSWEAIALSRAPICEKSTKEFKRLDMKWTELNENWVMKIPDHGKTVSQDSDVEREYSSQHAVGLITLSSLAECLPACHTRIIPRKYWSAWPEDADYG